MTYTITINASTPEELSAIIAKLHSTEVQAPAIQAPAVHDQLNYQQHQAIAPTVSHQAMQPSFTPDPSAQYQQPAQQQYSPDYGQPAPVQHGYQQQPGQAPMQSAVPTSAPMQQQQPMQQPTSVPLTTQTYTMDQLAVAATQLMDSGRQAELLNLLNNTYGAPSLMALPKEQYGNFATALRQMGAKI